MTAMLDLNLVYNLLLTAHILLLVYWLGGDLGVFYTSTYVTKPSVPPPTRAVIAKIFLWIDMAPRICLILMLPVSFTLGVAGGYLDIATPWIGALWVFGLAWLALAIAVYRLEQAPLGHNLAQVDFWLRVAVIIALVGVGIFSLTNGEPVEGAALWLVLKIFIYAGMILCGLLIRVVLRPFGGAFADLMSEGSTPETEARLKATLDRARPLVLLIWAGLLANTWLGVSKGLL